MLRCGAYFAGQLFGRHRLTPLLSPKKTWEGLLGGLILASAGAVGINRLGPVLEPLWLHQVLELTTKAVGINRLGPVLEHDVSAGLFGLTVGVAAVFGDLAESLIKRDCGQKDASTRDARFRRHPRCGGLDRFGRSTGLLVGKLTPCWQHNEALEDLK